MTVLRSLNIQNLDAGFGAKRVLRDLTLPSIRAGHITALVGPNGAGKTTLLRALAGLVPATGSAEFGAQDLLALSAHERARLVAFMPQFLPQRLALSVVDSVISALRAAPPDLMQGFTASSFRDAALATLERLGILDLALQPFDQLSGGQRQLASLAQSLARQPQLLLLDEPTSALDLRHQIQVFDVLRSEADAGTMVIAVLHDLQAAARCADSIIVLHGGDLYASGAPAKAITETMLYDVYRIAASVETTSNGFLHIQANRLIEA